MKISRLLFLCFVCCASFLLGGIFSFFDSERPSTADTASNEFIIRSGKKIKQKYGLRLGGIRGSLDEGKIDWLMMPFCYRGEPVTIEKARKLIVAILNEVSDYLQTDLKVRPYLKENFGIKNIKVAIFLSDKKGYPQVDPYVTTISAPDGQIIYRGRRVNEEFGYYNILRETYEEAVAILNEEKTKS